MHNCGVLPKNFHFINNFHCNECHALVNGYVYNNSTSSGSRAVYVYSGAVCCSGGWCYIYITLIVGKQAGQ